MAEQKFPTSSTPKLSIEKCQGDLVIRASLEAAVAVKGDQVTVNESDLGFSISSNGDLKLMVPEESALAIENVEGDLVIKNVSGDTTLGVIQGDVVLSGVGTVKINTIHSDLSAKNINGQLTADTIQGDAVFRRISDLNINTVEGDLSARVVDGEVTLAEVSGDITLRSINGALNILQCNRDVNLRNLGGTNQVSGVQGDIRLLGGLSAAAHNFEAERDIIVRWPVSQPIDFTAKAPTIVNRVALDKEVTEPDSLTGRLGDGQTVVTFKAGSRFILKEGQVVDSRWESEEFDGDAFDFDFANFGQQISAQVNEQISRFTSQIETKFGPDFTETISRKITRKAEEAAKKAEQAAERARQRAERQAARGARYSRPASSSPSPKRKKASQDEQIKILKMVEEGIISPDEAATLLEALEN